MMKKTLLIMIAAFAVGCVDMDDEELAAGEAESLRSAQFFSQRDPAWANAKLGHCASTIGTEGCAITATAMALAELGAQVDPGTLNDYLRKNDGYADGCLIIWKEAAAIDGPGGAKWVHTGVLGSPEALRAGLDQGKHVIAKSSRFNPHWVYITGYDGNGVVWSDFHYWDPWDTNPIVRRIGDGWVMKGAATRVFR